MANTIPLLEAQAWIQAWRDNPDLTVKAFFIPKADLTSLMQDPNNKGIRAYLALQTMVGDPPQSVPKLVLVDVEGDLSKGGIDVWQNGIYDFTSPCPQFCDVTSPLYTLVNNTNDPGLGGKTIDVDTAINWAKDWRLNPDPNVKAFFIPKEDIIDLINIPGTIGVRAYLGWGNTNKKAPEAKLMLVDVGGAIQTGGKDNILTGIYDFTSPCPMMCDVNSPLYTLQTPNNRSNY